jgi:3-dehydroquinate synthase
MHDPNLQEELIFRAVSVKAGVVGIDFKESYEREILNYGHTLGHAIEKHSGFTLRHGEAVAIGMCFIAELARLRIGLAEDVVALHRELIQGMKLPISYKKEVWDELLDLMALDKKAKAGTIRFVAIDAISSCTRIEDATFDEMKLAYERISL